MVCGRGALFWGQGVSILGSSPRSSRPIPTQAALDHPSSQGDQAACAVAQRGLRASCGCGARPKHGEQGLPAWETHRDKSWYGKGGRKPQAPISSLLSSSLNCIRTPCQSGTFLGPSFLVGKLMGLNKTISKVLSSFTIWDHKFLFSYKAHSSPINRLACFFFLIFIHLAQLVKEPACLPMQEIQETQLPSLGLEDSLEREMATHFSSLVRKIPWSDEYTHTHTHTHTSSIWLCRVLP